MNKDTWDESTRNAVTVLLEFYERGILYRFGQVCSDHGKDISEAYIFLKNMTMQNLAIDGNLRDFYDLAGIYAEHVGLPADEFAKHVYYVPGRDQ